MGRWISCLETIMRKALLISIFTYLLFFYPLLNINTYIGGEDPEGYHYPVKYFLYQSLQKGEFPFYTQRIFSGFPIYADPTAGYLNPLNIVFVMLFGPFNYYKIMHLVFYLTGSVGLYYFLKRKFGENLTAFAVSNVVYFFNLFNLYHQKHFEIVLAVYTLPLCLLLVDKFISKSDFKNLLFLGGILLFDFYNGSFQLLLIKMFVLGIYIIIFDKYLIKNTFKYIMFLLLFSLICIPLLVPAYELYVESSRVGGSYKLNEGSYSPIMAVNIVYPFIMGKNGEYKWNQVSEEYFIHETYIYHGVSAILIGVIGLLILKDKKVAFLSSFLVFLFIFLAFISFVPVLSNINIPIISMFRYWGRSAVLFSLVLSLGTYSFFTGDKRLTNFHDLKQNINIYKIPCMFFVFLFLISLTGQETIKVINMFFNGAIKKDINLVVWLLSTVLIFVLFLLHKFYTFNIKLIIVLIIFADLLFFGLQVLKPQYVDINKIKVYERLTIPEDSVTKKVYFYNDEVYKNVGLYYESNGIFGYSQMEPDAYSKYLKDMGFADVKYPVLFSDTTIKFNKYNTYGFYQKLEDYLGVNYILNSTGNVIFMENDSSLPFIINENIEYLNIKQNEFSFKINASEERLVNTFIRSYKEWDVTVDGAGIVPDYSEVFIKFNLPKGEHLVKFKYHPDMFFNTLLISFLSVVVITSSYAAIRIHKNGRI